MYRKTPIAAAELGITETNLHYLIRSRKLVAPARDSSGERYKMILRVSGFRQDSRAIEKTHF